MEDRGLHRGQSMSANQPAMPGNQDIREDKGSTRTNHPRDKEEAMREEDSNHQKIASGAVQPNTGFVFVQKNLNKSVAFKSPEKSTKLFKSIQHEYFPLSNFQCDK